MGGYLSKKTLIHLIQKHMRELRDSSREAYDLLDAELQGLLDETTLDDKYSLVIDENCHLHISDKNWSFKIKDIAGLREFLRKLDQNYLTKKEVS